MNFYTALLTSIVIISLTGCGDIGPDSPEGFSLPKGDIAKGKQAFIKHQCVSCHSIDGVSDVTVKREFEDPIILGGESQRITTYAELVTSVINPSHKISEDLQQSVIDENGDSKMRNYNDVMTVTELVDIVAYLQPKFKIKPKFLTPYGYYYPM
jgi:mono/diheme cytochrome c family protein